MAKEASTVEQYLSVGQPALIHVDPGRGDSQRHGSIIRGWQAGGYVLFDAPFEEGNFVSLPRSKPCVIRFLSEGRACGFNSAVLNEGSSRYPYLRMHWPRRVQCVSIRQHARVETQVPCVIQLEDGSKTEGIIRDLSAGGCCVDAHSAIDADSTIVLTFALPDATPVEGAKVTVKSTKASRNGWVLGCAFAESETHARFCCDFYVSSTLERMRGPARAPHRAVILEKDEGNFQSVREQLEGKGYEVSQVTGVLDAFFSLRMTPPGSLWMGHEQREMSPLEIAQIVHNTEGFRELPVYVYGGNDEIMKDQAADQGLAGYIPSIDMVGEQAPELELQSESPEESGEGNAPESQEPALEASGGS